MSFIFYKVSPIDPVAAYLAAQGIHNPSQAQYEATAHSLGLDLPLFIQFLRYIFEMFTGNWGLSVNKVRGAPVVLLIKLRLPRTIEQSMVPLMIGIGLGYLFGKLAIRKRGKVGDKVIQFISTFGILLPVFFLGMLFQYFFAWKLGWFEPTGYKSPSLTPPTFKTGFIILDALFEGNWPAAVNFIWHMILPGTILTIITFTLITRRTRNALEDGSHERSVISNSIVNGEVFGLILSSQLLVETIFNLDGFWTLFIDSIYLGEIFILRACLFLMTIAFVVIIFILNSLFMLNKFLIKRRSKGKNEIEINNKGKNDNNHIYVTAEETLKSYFLAKLKSPLFIIGTILVSFFIFVSIFPQSITKYSLAEAMAAQPGSWAPPSSEHPLGVTDLGRDVLARIMYGISNSLVFGITATLIGLAGGLLFGFIAGKFNRWGYKPVMGFLIIFYIFPALALVILFILVFGPIHYWVFLVSIGILLIPGFTRVIANAMSGDFNIHRISISIIIYIPLNFAIAILINTSLGFLGFWQLRMIELGNEVNIARAQLIEAPWAPLWPGLTIFGLVNSFLILHLGLKRSAPMKRKLVNHDFNELSHQSQL